MRNAGSGTSGICDSQTYTIIYSITWLYSGMYIYILIIDRDYMYICAMYLVWIYTVNIYNETWTWTWTEFGHWMRSLSCPSIIAATDLGQIRLPHAISLCNWHVTLPQWCMWVCVCVCTAEVQSANSHGCNGTCMSSELSPDVPSPWELGVMPGPWRIWMNQLSNPVASGYYY